MEFRINRGAQLFHGAYAILGGFLRSMVSPEPIQRAADMREGFSAMEAREM